MMEKSKAGGKGRKKSNVVVEDEGKKEQLRQEVKLCGEVTEEKEDGSPPAKKSPDELSKTPAATKTNKPKETPTTPRNPKRKSSSPPASPPAKQKKSADEEKEDVTSTSERGEPVPNLPDGWRRQAVVRKRGKTAGQIDIYFYSPDGTKLRSRPDVQSYLAKQKIDLQLEDFNFSKSVEASENAKKKAATVNNTTVKKKEKKKTAVEEKSKETKSKNSSKAKSPKKLKSPENSPVKVPPTEAEEKNNKIIINILPRKPKRSRK